MLTEGTLKVGRNQNLEKIFDTYFLWSCSGFPFGGSSVVWSIYGAGGQAVLRSSARVEESLLCGPVVTSRIPSSTSIWQVP